MTCNKPTSSTVNATEGGIVANDSSSVPLVSSWTCSSGGFEEILALSLVRSGPSGSTVLKFASSPKGLSASGVGVVARPRELSMADSPSSDLDTLDGEVVDVASGTLSVLDRGAVLVVFMDDLERIVLLDAESMEEGRELLTTPYGLLKPSGDFEEKLSHNPGRRRRSPSARGEKDVYPFTRLLLLLGAFIVSFGFWKICLTARVSAAGSPSVETLGPLRESGEAVLEEIAVAGLPLAAHVDCAWEAEDIASTDAPESIVAFDESVRDWSLTGDTLTGSFAGFKMDSRFKS
mmetsp:Transcript_1578/g.5075  ORF Transcript_1578/g.5075 Transcript_1578/m.5075 type:complete len:291 (-) Transcript_1578:829-1701(-)